MNKEKTSKKSPSPNIKEFHKELNKCVEKSGKTVSQLVKEVSNLPESTVYRMLDNTSPSVPNRINLFLMCVALDLDSNEVIKLWKLAYPETSVFLDFFTYPNLSKDEILTKLEEAGCLPDND